jgi:hypothetical protein
MALLTFGVLPSRAIDTALASVRSLVETQLTTTGR